MNLQEQFNVAVIIPTTLRASLIKAVASVFHQDFKGRIQILIGIDIKEDELSIIEKLKNDCPSNMAITVLDLGYSTSIRHGGIYSNKYSGAIRTVLSYSANSKYVAYLDDDDYWDKEHITDLLTAIEGKDWAFSLRWFVDSETGKPICKDEWDSVGPGKGINLDRFGGFVAPSNLILNKYACHHIFPYWSLSPFPDGTGEDRLVFSALLKQTNFGATDKHTSYYTIPKDVQYHSHHLKEFKARNIEWIYN